MWNRVGAGTEPCSPEGTLLAAKLHNLQNDCLNAWLLKPPPVVGLFPHWPGCEFWVQGFKVRALGSPRCRKGTEKPKSRLS